MITKDVVLQNGAGWTQKAIDEFRTLEGVTHVEGKALRADGRFGEVQITFVDERTAMTYAQIYAKEAGAKKIELKPLE